MNLKPLRSATSSPESEDGRSPSTSLDGETSQCGPEVAPANHSQLPENEKEQQTNDTYGPTSTNSLVSANLQQRLESRLRQRMAAYGSPEYALTWKHWDMQSGPPICALRASVRRISDRDYIGWPTARGPHGSGPSDKVTRGLTPEGSTKLIILKPWATPRARDHKNNGVSIARAAKGVADSLDLQCKLVCQNGTVPPSPLSARMDTGAAPLNPMHSLWLMGYPQEWESCAGPVIRLSHKSRRNLSKPT